MDVEEPAMHQGLGYAMALVSGPCIAMIILGFAVRVAEPPVLFVVSMQHLAAGIVLSAVAVELIRYVGISPSLRSSPRCGRRSRDRRRRRR